MQHIKNINEKGITIIALVITIIVMLILVVVTVNMALTGGIFDKAREATFRTEMAKVREIVKLSSTEKVIDGTEEPSLIMKPVPIEDTNNWDVSLKEEIINWGKYDIQVDNLTKEDINNRFTDIIGNDEKGNIKKIYYIESREINNRNYIYNEKSDIVYKIKSFNVNINKNKVHSIEQLDYVKIARLPDEYQEVKYIESTGTQYIDTEYIPNQNIKIETKYSFSNNNQNRYYIVGCYAGNIKGRLQFSQGNSTYFFGWGTQYSDNISVENVIGKIYNAKIYQGKFYVDGVLIWESKTTDFSSANKMVLFARNNGTVEKFSNGLQIMELKIYDRDVLVRNFIPCYRKLDKEIGMYDIVNDVFYTNQGTGEFLKGNNV